MGPGDPFASRPAPDRPSAPQSAPPSNGPAEGPVRIQARLPEPPPPPAGATRSAATVGAAVGLTLGLLFVLLPFGQALLVLVLTALGAAIGGLARSAFRDGVDVGAAWRALRRR
ncbi:hypothetical protein [Rubrivirga sp. IMCC45206]|uniref:hypothetical protein n=1 Tax=Rubrivirga sp. IMCC45206 TaxID=3391614 RepID=UPI00399029E1